MLRSVFFAVAIYGFVLPASAAEPRSFLGITLGMPLTTGPLSEPKPMGPLPIYSIRIPLSAPYVDFFNDATVNVQLKDDRVGLVAAERAYTTEKECKTARSKLVMLLQGELGIEKNKSNRGSTFDTEFIRADVSCVLSSGARYFVLSANATDSMAERILMEQLGAVSR